MNANAPKKTVAIGFAGIIKDLDKGRFNPSTSLCRHHQRTDGKRLVIDRFELLCGKQNDDKANEVKRMIDLVSPCTKVNICHVEDSRPWDLQSVYQSLLEWSDGYRFEAKEDYLIHMGTGTHVALICFFLLAHSKRIPGRLIQTYALHDNSDAYQIIDLDLAVYDALLERKLKEQKDAISVLKRGIPTRNARYNRVIEESEQAALRSDDPILLLGETGVGKSDLAKLIYEVKLRQRRVKPRFISINCSTLVGENAMAELFGTEQGRFTGVGKTTGRLSTVHEGVLVLDEIGELGLKEQAMLLEVVEKKEFFPCGSDQKVRSNFHLIAGTNKDLAQAVRAHAFREDLFARISLWQFKLPNLRDRPEDIEPNMEHELKRCARKVEFEPQAKAHFLEFARSPQARWRANFRDFNGSIRRLSVAADGKVTVKHVEREIQRLMRSWDDLDAPAPAPAPVLNGILSEAALDSIDPWDKVQLQLAVTTLREERNLANAGKKLFAASRKKREMPNDSDRLRKYLKKFGVDWRAVLKAD